LLKNEDNILPIDLEKTSKILVVGENAIKKMTVGGGSSSLKAQNECTPIVGLQEAIGDKAQIVYQRGYVGDLLRTYNSVDTGIDLTDPRSEDQLIADAVAEAADADIVLFFGGLNKAKGQDAEGRDRISMALPYAQDKVIEALAEVNKNIVVVIVSGNAVEMPWIDKVNGVVESWFLGSQAGHAIADVLLGKVNPSGKLPFTFPVKLEDNAAHALNAYHKDSLTVEYKEGIFVGYRWAEKQNIKPLFAFGHGLSYTTFEYGEATCRKSGDGFKVSIDVTNTGSREGKEIVQLYIGDDESSLERPVKELKGFKKVALATGETKRVTFEINPDMLKFYDPERGWVLEEGGFTAYVGAASDDIRSIVKFNI
jgi:beta-glucosidase